MQNVSCNNGLIQEKVDGYEKFGRRRGEGLGREKSAILLEKGEYDMKNYRDRGGFYPPGGSEICIILQIMKSRIQ